MVDNKESNSNRTAADLYDTARENVIRAMDEVAKSHPQYAQSISNLQLDYIQTAKNAIQTGYTVARQFAGYWNIPITPAYAEQFAKQTNDFASNFIRTLGINNQLGIQALEAARGNLNIYNKTVDAVTDFGNNVSKAWTSFFTAQQQQLFRH